MIIKNAWVNQQYLPDNIKNKKYYIPKETSNYEMNFKASSRKTRKFAKNRKRHRVKYVFLFNNFFFFSRISKTK